MKNCIAVLLAVAGMVSTAHSEPVRNMGIPLVPNLLTLEDIDRSGWAVLERNIQTKMYRKEIVAGKGPVYETLWAGVMKLRTIEGTCVEVRQAIESIQDSPRQGNGETIQLPHVSGGRGEVKCQ